MIQCHTTGERDILSLKALCDNSSNGCDWVGELRSLDEHLDNCGFTLLPCPNKCSKDDSVVQLLRKDLEKHKNKECPRRQYQCPHCKEAGEYQGMITKHLDECPMVEVPCPKRRCKTHLIRRDLSNHRKECLFEMVPCKFSIIGCTEEVERKDLEEHEGDSQNHLQLAMNTVQQQQIKIENMQAQSREMPVLYKFTTFNQHKIADNKIYSPAFYTSPKGYKMCIRVYPNGSRDGKDTHVSVFASLMNGENDDYLPWPFTGTVTVELLNQLEDKNHHSRSMEFPSDNDTSQRVVDKVRAGIGWGWSLYISHSDLGHNIDKNCQYLKDDRLHFKISVDAASSSTPWLI
jgi:TNF receptor-associated factor 4